jgi:hypothetical protein
LRSLGRLFLREQGKRAHEGVENQEPHRNETCFNYSQSGVR